MNTYIDLNNFELVGERVEIKINPHSPYDKRLKFLRNMQGEISRFAKLEGDLYPTHCGYTFEGNFFIVPQGGPKLISGEMLPNKLGYKVLDIIYKECQVNGDFYVLELKEIKDDILSIEPEDDVPIGGDNITESE